MAPPDKNSLRGLLSIFVIVAVTYLLFLYSSHPSDSEKVYHVLIAALLTWYNPAILLCHLAFGWLASGVVTFFALFVGIVILLRTGSAALSTACVSFLIVWSIALAHARAKTVFERTTDLESEKLEEDINLLADDIEKKRRDVESIDAKEARLLTLKEVSETLSTILSSEEIKHLIIEKSLQTLGKHGRVLLFLVDTERQGLCLAASKNADKVKTKNGDVFDHYVVRSRKSLIVEDVQKDFRFHVDDAEMEKGVFRSLIATPFMGEKKVTGVLRIDSLQEGYFAQDDLRLLDIIADLGAVALQNADFYARTQELATHDGLTGLILRRFFLERFREEMLRVGRKKGALALLMLDIDHFKAYNDRYGHMAGDLVLKHIARTVNSMERKGDVVARYGGEEFAVLLFGADKKEARLEAEAIRKRIEREPLILRRQEMCVTVSIGVSAYPEDATVEGDLIKMADERLYKAKSRGRNRVCA